MNIFALHCHPVIAARLHFDKHVVKMILESAQLLSTAHHMNETSVDRNLIYKKTHFNHPCAIWARESTANYNWLYELFVSLCDEYELRYNRVHMTRTKMEQILKTPPVCRLDQLTPFAQAMPEQYRSEDAVLSYRSYYMKEKWSMFSYRVHPEALHENLDFWEKQTPIGGVK